MDHSQFGESPFIASLFQRIPLGPKHVVEFGCGDGYSLSNARFFLDEGWTGTLWDTETWVTAENVNRLFAEAGVPEDVDLVSIDIDGNDYWVWRALEWEPSVVCIEYNALWPRGWSLTIAYDPRNVWDHSIGYSASLDAMLALAEAKGYFLAGETGSTNLIFVHERHRGRVSGLDPDSIELGWQFWVERGRPCTKEWVPVPGCAHRVPTASLRPGTR